MAKRERGVRQAGTIGAILLVAVTSLLLAGAETLAAEPARLDLDGVWQLAEAPPAPAESASSTTQPALPQVPPVTAHVPGTVHTDLLAAGAIPDPFYRDNERQLQWIGHADWTYSRSFDVSAGYLQHPHVRLICQQLDTLASIRINGHLLGQTDNMFRTWDLDAKPYLQSGRNVIAITFASTYPYMQAHRSQRQFPGLIVNGTGYVRKEPCSYGWDWGPTLVTAGIEKPIYLLAYDHARWDCIGTLQDHHDKHAVKLGVNLAAETDGQVSLSAEVTVSFAGQTVAQTTVPLDSAGYARATLTIHNPQLWWPNGMGPQNLYQVHCDLREDRTDGTHPLLDTLQRRIGLRTIDWLAATDKRPLGLAVNGREFFARGASWIPSQTFLPQATPASLQRYVNDAVAANFNMLRFWGGGAYEEDALFDACDAAGLLVWLDFKFANNAYPAFDPVFNDNVRQEVRDQVDRLRNHPCIAVWCGNNEVASFNIADSWTVSSRGTSRMGRPEYNTLFHGIIADAVHELVPLGIYTPGSPESGDTHNWGVWHHGKLFESYEQAHGLMTEFGFQSFPVPATVRAYTNAEDRQSVLSPVMVWHQRNGNKVGNSTGNQDILKGIADYFRQPKDFDSTLWVSQINQAMGMKTGVEHWRRDWPNSTGSLIWQFDDCWPVASWSSVDYFGRWKALHYLARHFFAPIEVNGKTDADPASPGYGTAKIYVCNDKPDQQHGVLKWQATDVAGNVLDQNSLEITIPPGTSSTNVVTLQLAQAIHGRDASQVLVWLSLEVDGQPVASNLLWFGRPGDLDLLDPQIKTAVQAGSDDHTFAVTMTAAHPALWAWLDMAPADDPSADPDARYDDNFIHLQPNVPATIHITTSHPMTVEQVQRVLRARSLFDTYDPSATRPAPTTAPSIRSTTRPL